MHSLWFILTLAVHSGVFAAPAPSAASSAPASTPTIPYASTDPNYPLWNETTNVIPEPIRGTLGAKVIGPQNVALELQNPDLLAPPSTDHGAISNFKWPFSSSHNRLATGGWARQQNVFDMPVATALAGVNMRLEAGAIRELHWHDDGEWAYVLKGDARVSTMTPNGQVYIGDVSQGDLWYFPAGFPHSLQAKNTTTDGVEFLLIFDNGAFSEDDTFSVTDWLAHIPKEVIAKNFQIPESAFDHIPSKELYIFPSTPPPMNIEQVKVIPNNTPLAYTFPLSQLNSTKSPGGSYKIIDTRLFPASTTISAVEAIVEVGGMRELHWHPTQPEWTYFISGHARITAFASNAKAQTFDFHPGDIAYIPPSYGHYIENTGNTPVHLLEIFKSPIVQDISLNQWLALTPVELVKAHLNLDDATISKLSKVKQEIVGSAQAMQ